MACDNLYLVSRRLHFHRHLETRRACGCHKVESDEMAPFWVQDDAVPFDDMWLDDAHWFPYFLRDVRYVASLCRP